MNKWILCVAALPFLAACTHSGGGDAPAPADDMSVPQTLNFQAPSSSGSAQPMSAQDSDEFAKLAQGASIDPVLEDVFGKIWNDPTKKATSVGQDSDSSKNLSVASQMMVSSIKEALDRKDCVLTSSTTGNPDAKPQHAGDVLSFGASGDLKGLNCPATGSYTSSVSVNVKTFSGKSEEDPMAESSYYLRLFAVATGKQTANNNAFVLSYGLVGPVKLSKGSVEIYWSGHMASTKNLSNGAGAQLDCNFQTVIRATSAVGTIDWVTRCEVTNLETHRVHSIVVHEKSDDKIPGEAGLWIDGHKQTSDDIKKIIPKSI